MARSDGCQPSSPADDYTDEEEDDKLAAAGKMRNRAIAGRMNFLAPGWSNIQHIARGACRGMSTPTERYLI